MLEKIAILIIGAGITIAVWVITNLFLNRKRHDTPCSALTIMEKKVEHTYNKTKDQGSQVKALELEQAAQKERDEWFKTILSEIKTEMISMNEKISKVTP